LFPLAGSIYRTGNIADDALVGQVEAIQRIKLISRGIVNGRFSHRRNS